MATTQVVDADPGELDLKLYEGNPLNLAVTWDVDLDDFTDFKAQVRAAPDPTVPVALELDPDLSDLGSRRVVFRAAGTAITVALDGYGYDVQAVPGGESEPRTYLAGRLEVTARYTHP